MKMHDGHAEEMAWQADFDAKKPSEVVVKLKYSESNEVVGRLLEENGQIIFVPSADSYAGPCALYSKDDYLPEATDTIDPDDKFAGMFGEPVTLGGFRVGDAQCSLYGHADPALVLRAKEQGWL